MNIRPLHPNLAKLAASYDEIIERYAQGSISAAAAQREVASLVARDDEGVQWSIDPFTGEWMRKTREGNLVAGEPPSYGLETATPYDISGARRDYLSEERVHLHEVDNELLYSPSQFAGSTRARYARNGILEGAGALSGARKIFRAVIGLALVALLAVSGVAWWHDSRAGHPSTTTTSTVVRPSAS